MENYDGFLDNELPVLLLCNSVYQGLMQNASVRLNAHLEISNSLRSIFDCIVHMLFDKLGELFGSQHLYKVTYALLILTISCTL